MARTLEPTGQFQRERSTYPWDAWLDGKPHELKQDAPERPGDFWPEPRTFRTHVYRAARKRGLKVVITIEGSMSLMLQSYAPGTPRPVLPSSVATHANGKPAAVQGPTLRDKGTCSVCGAALNGWGAESGRCHKFNRATGKAEDVHGSEDSTELKPEPS